MSRITTMAMMLMGRGDEASCAEVARHLQSYLDGQTDVRQLRRIEKHLDTAADAASSCPRGRRETVTLAEALRCGRTRTRRR